MLAFYDLCAVLSPCGPLKALVNLMQEKDSPDMPGLLFEAQLPRGASRPNPRSRANRINSRSNEENNEMPEDDDDQSEEAREAEAMASRSNVPPPAAFGRNQHETESTTPLTNRSRATIPLALAKCYKLPLVSQYEAPSSRRRGRGRFARSSKKGDSPNVVNESPLLDNATPAEFYERHFSKKELLTDVEVEFPHDGGRIEKDVDGSTGRGGKYNVFGRNGELRRTLEVSRDGKVYEVDDDDDDDESEFEEKSTIRLGLVSKICLFFNPQKTMPNHIFAG